MNVAEKRRRNRALVARMRAETPPKTPGTLRSDGLTGAEILEIWQRSGKITGDRGPAELGREAAKQQFVRSIYRG